MTLFVPLDLVCYIRRRSRPKFTSLNMWYFNVCGIIIIASLMNVSPSRISKLGSSLSADPNSETFVRYQWLNHEYAISQPGQHEINTGLLVKVKDWYPAVQYQEQPWPHDSSRSLL
jgi:hypothetical protein